MAPNIFDPIVFILDGSPIPLPDARTNPYLYNHQGHPQHLRDPKGVLIEMAAENPDLERGTRYTNISHREKPVPDASYSVTLFDFKAKEVHYEALRATPETARAFGMTLLRNGECIRFEYEGLVCSKYTYGKWAGHQSPYLEAARRRELLTCNPTDLEFHDFPHVFFSQDSHPLVISVARWRPYVNEISLADLWLAPGDAIVLPPKVFPSPPRPGASYAEAKRKIVDLHGNRNSAFACWSDPAKPTLLTETILANAALMASAAAAPHYHEEVTPTRHATPAA
ncbi:hypothetical protein [Collimonas humicola]|uniref:hypothetical protein n=1 Tax=Collimonas humicola TaxID=2825886 RepID=UPI002E77711D|nr:hypothetical protein [Collimonas humicola]